MNEKNKNHSFGQCSRTYQSQIVSCLNSKACSVKQAPKDRDIRNLKDVKTLKEVEIITRLPERHKQGTLKPCKEFSKAEMGKILVKKRAANIPKENYIVNECWPASATQIPLKLCSTMDEPIVDDDSIIPAKKQKLEKEEEGTKSPPYTKEFHLLSEVQKTRILHVVEDVVKKLAIEDYHQAPLDEEERPTSVISYRTTVERLFCKKFLLPWMTMKVAETILCHIIQVLFLAENSYFQKKREYLPIVVTYYLTLFIIILSLVIYIGSFSYAGIQNPCYLMGIISSSILTLTTTFGIMVMLISMDYYRAFLQILVLLLLGILLCILFGELLLCYVEVKNMWNKVGHFEQFYIT